MILGPFEVEIQEVAYIRHTFSRQENACINITKTVFRHYVTRVKYDVWLSCPINRVLYKAHVVSLITLISVTELRRLEILVLHRRFKSTLCGDALNRILRLFTNIEIA